MTIRKLYLAWALALVGLSLASSRSYDIRISSPTTAGAAKLAPGLYSLEVKGNNAIFKDVNNTSKSVTTPVRVETGDKKFAGTNVTTGVQGDGIHIQTIQLGGSKAKLVFD